jgi:hypothetical protein
VSFPLLSDLFFSFLLYQKGKIFRAWRTSVCAETLLFSVCDRLVWESARGFIPLVVFLKCNFV